jgi:2-C-methyl-D-erythritol 2,4-cyclodiphosphate synthase
MAANATHPPDLRVGYGRDSHPFGPGLPLRLGGVEIPGAPRLHGHSDGDVALHAVAGALLAAASLGDLGTLFPADARTPRGIASAELLGDVAARLHAAGWRAATVAVNLLGARPRLGPHLAAMRSAIAGLLDLEPDVVSVQASTGNLSGDEGAGRTISAAVVATVIAIGSGS